MRTKGDNKNLGTAAQRERERKKQQQFRNEAAADEALREQTKTETEQRPYLDTEGGD